MSIEIEKKARVPENDFLEVARKMGEAYGKGGLVRKQDTMFKNAFSEDNKVLRLRKNEGASVWSNSNGTYEVCSKVKSLLADGTEVNEEIETNIKVDDIDVFKKALENAGLVYEYSKTKSGFEWTINLTADKEPFTLHAELMRITCDNGYQDFFLEIEYTGDCKKELSEDYVSKQISNIFNKLKLTDIEPRKYVTLILGK